MLKNIFPDLEGSKSKRWKRGESVIHVWVEWYESKKKKSNYVYGGQEKIHREHLNWVHCLRKKGEEEILGRRNSLC